jgi:hypothetical protein
VRQPRAQQHQEPQLRLHLASLRTSTPWNVYSENQNVYSHVPLHGTHKACEMWTANFAFQAKAKIHSPALPGLPHKKKNSMV